MLGVVMAGGESRRFGADKATVLVDGEPLWRRQMQVLKNAGADRVVLVRRHDQSAPEGIECWRDRFSGIGPIAGLHAAMSGSADEFVAILAVDMPGISAAWFRQLASKGAPGIGAIARHADACEPLAAIYPRAAREDLERQIERGEYSLQAFARALAAGGKVRWMEVDGASLPSLRSMNTREQLAAWRATSAEGAMRFELEQPGRHSSRAVPSTASAKI
jgi:molybdopterin-guanine dinucleotide biosynthesis protein A